MTKKVKGIILGIVAVIVAAVGGGILYLYFTLTGSVPQVEGELALSGLHNPAQITYDSLGIPQIWAIDEHDAYFALGYQHAADRFFQMEIARRVAQGRLSELLGTVALKIDLRQRAVGHRQLAEEALNELAPADSAILQAYVDGVNSYITVAGSPPFEFTLLGKQMEEWKPADCLALLSFQTWFSDAIQNRDEFFLRVAEKLGEDKAKTLLLPYPDWAPFTVPQVKTLGSGLENESGTTGERSPLHIGHLRSVTGEFKNADFGATSEDYSGATLGRAVLSNNAAGLGLTLGSNGWTVSPKKTASGKAILAGDPHLDITRLPQFWYAAGLHIARTDQHTVGITAPGLPFFVMGTNGASAWTMTAAGIDQTDFFAEKVNPDDSSQYLTPEGWKEFETRAETLQTFIADSVIVEQIRTTVHGPVFLVDDSLDYVYAIRWSGFDANLALAFHSGIELARTSDFQRFRQTVTNLGSLNANWLYADTAGNIGYQLGAPIPIRPKATLNLAYRGWEKVDSWKNYRPLDETPWALNPSQGWLANCNNKQDDANLSYELTGAFFADRILRLSEQLENESQFDVAKTQQLQTEWVDEYFLRWREEIANLLDSIGEPVKAETMRKWDGSASRGSRETAIIAEFIYQLKQLTFSDELGEDAKSIKRLWVDQVYHSSYDFWFDDITTDDTVETRADIARQAIANAVAAVGDSAWGEIHSLTISHPFAVIPGLGAALGLQKGPFSRGGTGGTINASYYQEASPGVYKTLAGPSWRFVIDMADPQTAWMCLPAGNSGNPFSPHFFDFFPLWNEGRYLEVPLDHQRAIERAATVLKLAPSAKEQ